jgi:branched-chain amino acid aminotransferase
MAGSQDYAPDPRNDHILVWLNGELIQRREAKVSIFDAGFALGDGVWEGLRLHKGALLFLEAHLDRLYRGAEAIRLDIGRDRAQTRPRHRRPSPPTP